MNIKSEIEELDKEMNKLEKLDKIRKVMCKIVLVADIIGGLFLISYLTYIFYNQTYKPPTILFFIIGSITGIPAIIDIILFIIIKRKIKKSRKLLNEIKEITKN